MELLLVSTLISTVYVTFFFVNDTLIKRFEKKIGEII